MLMLRLLCISALLAFTISVPVRKSSSKSDILERAKHYAALHPNKETVNEECSVLNEGNIIAANDDEINPLNAVTDPRLLWPNNTVYYTIENGVYTAEQIELIEAGITDLQRLTMVNGELCIKIQPRETQPNFVFVQNYSGCSSYLGMIGGSQRMSLVDNCVVRHGTIMHEFLHALGFHHEQKRSDRDDYIEVNWNNIQSGTENNFIKLPPALVNLLGTEYDYGSVMHYGAYGFAIDPAIPTIIPHDPDAEIGQRLTLSEIDIERVQIFYSCLDPADSKHFKNLDKTTLFRK